MAGCDRRICGEPSYSSTLKCVIGPGLLVPELVSFPDLLQGGERSAKVAIPKLFRRDYSRGGQLVHSSRSNPGMNIVM